MLPRLLKQFKLCHHYLYLLNRPQDSIFMVYGEPLAKLAQLYLSLRSKNGEWCEPPVDCLHDLSSLEYPHNLVQGNGEMWLLTEIQSSMSWIQALQ